MVALAALNPVTFYDFAVNFEDGLFSYSIPGVDGYRGDRPGESTDRWTSGGSRTRSEQPVRAHRDGCGGLLSGIFPSHLGCFLIVY